MKRHHLAVIIGVFFSLFLLSGCSLFGSGSKSDSDQIGEYGEYGSLTEEELARQREGRFGDGAIPMAEEDGLFRAVRFDFDSSNLTDMGRQNLEYNIQVLRQNPQIKVQLEGHCDERGTAEYNMALGQRRAQTVYEELTAAGIARHRLQTISYGKEVPLDRSGTEEAWAKNRRVNFGVMGSVN